MLGGILKRFGHYLNNPNNIAILMYHGFTNVKNFVGIENHHGKHLEIEKFRQQIAYLKKYYHIVSLEQVLDAFAKTATLPPRSVVITMDDGYRSNYTLAYPVLKEFDAPATIFITTDFIEKQQFLWVDRIEYALNKTACDHLQISIDEENLSFTLGNKNLKEQADTAIKTKLKRMPKELREAEVVDIEDKLGKQISGDPNPGDIYCPLQWEEVAEMARNGLVTIGSHTRTHVIMTQCNAEQMANELKSSKALIEKQVGKCEVFAYPNGGLEDFNDQTEEMLKTEGFTCGLTTVIGINNLNSNVFELRRLNIHNAGNLTSFIMTLSALFRGLRKIKNSATALLTK